MEAAKEEEGEGVERGVKKGKERGKARVGGRRSSAGNILRWVRNFFLGEWENFSDVLITFFWGMGNVLRWVKNFFFLGIGNILRWVKEILGNEKYP